MAAVNRVFLMGNLTRDPAARRIGAGTVVADLALAISDRYRNKNGEMIDKTCFVDVVVWNKQAEACETYLQKGAPVLVEGRLQQDEWTDDQGSRRSKIRVRADRVHFLGGPKKAQAQAPEPATAGA